MALVVKCNMNQTAASIKAAHSLTLKLTLEVKNRVNEEITVNSRGL